MSLHRLEWEDGRVAEFRAARLDEAATLEALIEVSSRELSRDDYTDEQIELALGGALGVDRQLLRDATYFVAEVGDEIVACGGWSYRKTLFGSDDLEGREPERLDPAVDAAKVRAFFVHPDWARRGLGTALLDLCESQASAAGFRRCELMATLPGKKLYERRGYVAESSIQYPLRDDLTIEFVPMRKTL